MSPGNLHEPGSETDPKPPRLFATTRWSVIAQAQKGDSVETRAALERICLAYWRPVHVFIRRSSNHEETAKDLTQGFFERFLEKEYVRDADQLRGRFRSFLLACVKHYLANDRARQRAQRRGGGATPISIEHMLGDSGLEPESDPALSPDRHYERQWALSVLENARFKLRSEFVEAGRSSLFEALNVYLSGDRDEAPYAVVADELGVSVDVVKKSVERMRRRFGQLIREEIAQTVLHPSEIEDELRFLRAALKS